MWAAIGKIFLQLLLKRMQSAAADNKRKALEEAIKQKGSMQNNYRPTLRSGGSR